MEKTAIILTGGTSSRLGTDKGLLNFKGKPLTSWIIEAVKPHTEKIFVVCSKQQAQIYGASLLDVNIIKDVYSEKSPIIGLISGLRAAKSGYAFITACDMPFIKTNLVSFLFKQAEGKGGSIVVKPDGWIEPFLSVVKVSSTLTEAERLYRAGDFRIRMVMRNILDMNHIKTEVLKNIDPDLISLIDIDTMEQLIKVKKIN
jgi:molybdopterin-guanine dinucleotide biosynthesis protein A